MGQNFSKNTYWGGAGDWGEKKKNHQKIQSRTKELTRGWPRGNKSQKVVFPEERKKKKKDRKKNNPEKKRLGLGPKTGRTFYGRLERGQEERKKEIIN